MHEDCSVIVTEVTEFLKSVCNDSRLSFWFYKDLKNNQQQILHPDMVHRNDYENHKLFRTINGAMC